MMKKEKARNILMPHSSYIVIGNEKIPVTSLRISENPEIKKFGIYLVNNQEIVQTFHTKALTIKLYTNTKIDVDVFEFVTNNKKTIASIFIPQKCSEEEYKKYIEAMTI